MNHDVAPTTPTPDSPLRRRGVLLAAAGTALGIAAIAAPTAARANTTETVAVPMLEPGADWNAALLASPLIQLRPGATYILHETVSLPDGAIIHGNGATVTVADESFAAFAIDRKRGVVLRDIRFLGRDGDPLGTAPVFSHVAVQIKRGTDVWIDGCRFEHWRGAGVVVTGSGSDDVFRSGSKIHGSTFRHCYFGVSIADRAEYGTLEGNHFIGCRLGIWNSSGNWLITGNQVVSCYSALYTIAQSSPYGQYTSDNWAHGNVSSNTFNHSSGGGGPRWSTNAAFPINGVTEDPGTGIVIRSVIPPTFTGNALWYTNLTAASLQGTRWLLSGCTFSNLTISCTGSVPIHIVGTQSNGTGNAPTLSGEVRDLLPL